MLVKGVTKIFSDCADCIIQIQKPGQRLALPPKKLKSGLFTISAIFGDLDQSDAFADFYAKG